MKAISLKINPKRHRFPAWVIETSIRKYHSFPLSYRQVQKILLERKIEVTYESIRRWAVKFSDKIRKQLKKKRKSLTWHIDEAYIKINETFFYVYRAVDENGYTLDVYVQEKRDKAAARVFFKKILGNNEPPKTVVTDKLASYTTPIKELLPNAKHRRKKWLNNRVENAHQPMRKKEKVIQKFKSIPGAQNVISLMAEASNYFSTAVNRNATNAQERKEIYLDSISIWQRASLRAIAV